QVKHEEAVAEAPAPAVAPKAEKKKGPSPSTLRHAVKKAEDRMAQLTADLARLDDDLANAAVNDPKKLEGLTRARAKAQTDLDQAGPGWIARGEGRGEVACWQWRRRPCCPRTRCGRRPPACRPICATRWRSRSADYPPRCWSSSSARTSAACSTTAACATPKPWCARR